MRERVRCRDCGKRKTSPRKLIDYIRPPRCKQCKSARLRSDEHNRNNEMNKRKSIGELCRCHFYPFPHERGSVRFCQHHKDYGTEPSENELDSYRACIAKSLSK